MPKQTENDAPQMRPEQLAQVSLKYIDEYVNKAPWNMQCHIALVKVNPRDWNDPSDVQFVEHLLFTTETGREVRQIASYVRQGYEPVGWVMLLPDTKDACFWTEVDLFPEYVNANPEDYIDDVIYDRWIGGLTIHAITESLESRHRLMPIAPFGSTASEEL